MFFDDTVQEIATSATDDVRRGIYFDKMAPKNKPANFMSMEEGLRRVRRGLFAFAAIDSALYGNILAKFEEHEKCDLYELREYTHIGNPHVVTRRDSPISHVFKIK